MYRKSNFFFTGAAEFLCTHDSSANQDKNISLVVFEQIPRKVLESLKDFSNLNMIRGDISKEFVSGIQNSGDVIIFATVNKTDAKLYKQVKKMIQEMNKNVLNEVLV